MRKWTWCLSLLLALFSLPVWAAIDADWHAQVMPYLTNPNVAYILALVALYGIFFEFMNPGMVLPGLTGVISLLLALYAFQFMPVNYIGLALIYIGVGFMIFEVHVASFGVVGLAGIIAFVVGSFMLYDTNDPNFRVSIALIVAMTAITVGLLALVITMLLRSHKKPIITGHEALIGGEGTAIHGGTNTTMQINGEIWNAQSAVMLTPGQRVRVIKVDGLTLIVVPSQQG